MAWCHGRCRGGPLNTKNLCHASGLIRIGFDPDSLKTYPAQRASTIERPCVFGSYIFDSATREWQWDESSVSPEW